MVTPELRNFAAQIADAARLATMPAAGERIAVDNKGTAECFDPVTRADRDAEEAMRRLIEEAYPTHGWAGEELGSKSGSSPFSWSLDPIDGTRSYVCGLPTWTTLIALLENGAPVLGIIDAPGLDERFIGDGASAWCERAGISAPIQSSGCTRLGQARLSTTDPYLFSGADETAFAALRGAVRMTRYGHDGYAYARLAAGTLDLVVECALKPHDYHALVPVVRGAGGVFGDWAGGSDFTEGRVLAAATPQLYEAAVDLMRTARPPGDAGGGPR